jgi:hypothetical protein
MAIGRVGSFATVEPVLVDFGSMAERNIDKIKAEEQAKAAAEAKAKKEDLKEVKDVDAFKLSGVTGYDKTLSGTVNGMYQKFLDAKEMYNNTGDRSYLFEADKIRNEVSAINNESQAIASTLSKFAELSKSGKINSEIADEKLLELQAIKDGKAEYSFENGKTMITFKDDEGNITNKVPASGYVTNMLADIPDSFNVENNMNETVSKVKASTNEVGSALFQRKTTDIKSPESEPQRKSLQNTAEFWSNNNGAMASWYQSKRAQERANGNILPLKTTNWTEDERKEAQDYFYNQLINKYAKEVTIQAQQPREDGSGSKKDKLKPTIFNPSAKFDYAPGQGISYSGNPTDSPVLGSFMVDRTLSDGSKKRIQITNATIKNIFIDKNGNVKMFYDELTGNLSKREIQDKINDIDDLLGLGRISEGEAKKQKETLKTQSSKTKGTQELVIRRTDEDLLGMIANSMNFESTGELLNRLDELGGRKGGSNKAKRSIPQIMKEDKVSFAEASKRFNNQ